MAGYSTSNPPKMVLQGIAGKRFWEYNSVDAPSLVQVTGYFTNAYQLGMKVGDIVFITDNDSSPYQTSIAVVVTVSASTGAADLSNVVSVGGASNSD